MYINYRVFGKIFSLNYGKYVLNSSNYSRKNDYQRLPRKTMQEIKRNSLWEIKKIMPRYKSDNNSDTIK